MDKSILNSFLRFLLLWIAQVFIFKQLFWGWGGQIYVQVHICILFILLLPFNTPRSLLLLFAFTMGIGIDLFYESYGIFAASLVFTAYIRDLVIKVLTPREKYSIKDQPTKDSLGDVWFFRYAGILVFSHLFFYYSIEAFTFVFMGTILLKTILSWLATMFFIFITVYITNPKT